MIVALELRSQFLTILNGLIGTYRFSDRSTQPALAILPDSNHGWGFPNNGTVTTGIECLIIRPYPGAISLLGGRHKPMSWNIELKQWDATKNLIEATERLVNKIDYQITSPRLVPPNPGLGIIEQVKFSIIEHAYIGV